MAIIPQPTNATKLFEQFRSRLESRAGITNFSADSVTRSLIDAIVVELTRTEQSYKNAFSASQIASATGKDLDAIGSSTAVGILTRLSPSRATVSRSERNLAFYTATTFGNINSGGSITLPLGTQISVRPTPSASTLVTYTLTEALVCPAGSSSAYASAQASTLGSFANVAARALSTHNFTSYTDSANSSLLVTNYFPIITGRNQEDDASYRYRLSNAFSTLNNFNENKVRLTGLSIPGAVDVRVVPGYYGAGTAAAFVFGADGESTNTVVSTLQQRLNDVRVPGVRVIASAGIRVYFDFTVNVATTQAVTAAQQRAIEYNVRRSMTSYFSDNVSRDRVSLETIRSRILTDNSNLPSIMISTDRTNMLKEVFVRRGFATSYASSEQESLLVDTYDMEDGEFASLGNLTVTYETSV